jgi:dinuclear metal center YbgI/SA1388 family protein
MTLIGLDHWFRALLDMEKAQAADPSRNGIQVSRRNTEVVKVAFAVDACRETIRRASEWGADVLFVHHGIFWDRPVRLDGALYERVRLLVEKDIALYASHLPLDMHPEVGNNIAIARHLGLAGIAPFGEYKGLTIGFKGTLPAPLDLEGLIRKLTGGDPASTRFLPFGPSEIRSVGVISGGGSFEVAQAIAEGLDAYITGEPSHTIYHDCLESKIHAIFAGHYATETFGVRLLAERVSRETGLETRFIDVPTGL